MLTAEQPTSTQRVLTHLGAHLGTAGEMSYGSSCLTITYSPEAPVDLAQVFGDLENVYISVNMAIPSNEGEEIMVLGQADASPFTARALKKCGRHWVEVRLFGSADESGANHTLDASHHLADALFGTHADPEAALVTFLHYKLGGDAEGGLTAKIAGVLADHLSSMLNTTVPRR